MHDKLHSAVTAATKMSALPRKVTNLVGGERRLAWLVLFRQRIYMQIWNHKTVCYIVGSDDQLDCFAFLQSDLRRRKGKTLCVNFDSATRFLRNDDRG